MTLRLHLVEGVLHIEGEVDGASAQETRDRLLADAPAEPTPLDLLDLDLDDGVAVVEMVNAVRALRDRWGHAELRHAPQMLAHTLYKVGDLRSRITLVAPREDEGTTAN